MSTAPPTVFGAFRVLHQVGAGALGPLFRAYDPDHDRLVAVKCFRLDLTPDGVHRLVAELEKIVAAGLTHPAIARPLAAGIAGVDAYLVQEYVAADALDTVVRERGALPPAEALRIGRQLADALDAAAAAALGHGALHPRDILLASDQPRLTGLGIARALEAVGLVAPVRRPYTAPERAAGAAWNRSADVFSLAALVHELLWGRRVAGTGRQVADSLTEIAGFDLDELLTTFARALAENPDDRFATATEFVDALESAHEVGRTASLPVCLSTDVPDRRDVRSESVDGRKMPPSVGVSSNHEATFAKRHPDDPYLQVECKPGLGPPVERFTDIDVTPGFPTAAAEPEALRPQASGPQALWPVAAVLLVGAILGSAVGYLVSSWLVAQGL